MTDPLQELRRAIVYKGPRPLVHDSIQQRHRIEWPSLWAAIDKLLVQGDVPRAELRTENEALNVLVNELSGQQIALFAELNQADATISATLAELVTRTNERDTLRDMLTDQKEELDMAEAEIERLNLAIYDATRHP